MATMSLGIQNEPQAAQPRVLIADDQPDVLEALRLLLKGHGYLTEAVTSPGALLEVVARREFDLILMDLNYARDTTSGREGLDLLAQLKTMDGAPPIVIMTGWATVGLAVEAMQRGGGDFIEKPWSNVRLLEVLKTQIELGHERRRTRRLAMDERRAQSEIVLQFQKQERENEEARKIQQGFLPEEIPQIPGFEVVCAWQPARIVGGDYYDVLLFGADSLGLCIADVAGKGMPAALLMSNLQASFRGLASPAMSPDELCTRLNSLMSRNIASDRFITLFYAQLDGPSRRLRYTNCGHNAPFVLHRDGSHHRLSEGGSVLWLPAGLQTESFTQASIELAPGDRILFFTDGVTEACGPDDEEFGEERLLRLLEENIDLRAAALQDKILAVVGDFCYGNWRDDATLIVITVE
jgi:phosphoserine phosphatase RsbU/P